MLRYNTEGLTSFLKEADYAAVSADIAAASRMLREGNGRGNDFIGWRDLPETYDKEEYARIKAAAKRIRETSDILIVIGIGGSYLGARAVTELLLGELHNEISKPRIYFAGCSLSPDDLDDLIRICDTGEVSVNVISKSGTTTEPAVAFRLFKAYLEKRYGAEEAARRIYATTDRSRGTLKQLSDELGYETFVVPDDVGGRYSVLTAVGLLPLEVAGIDTEALIAGAQHMREVCHEDDSLENPVNLYAAVRTALYRAGKSVELLSCFEPRFRMMGEWYKQLYGESEGKEGKGLLPASCVFTSDLHSMGQYIQDGERFLQETVVFFDKCRTSIVVPSDEVNLDGLNYLAGRELSYVNEKAMEATKAAHIDGGVPVSVLHLDSICEEEVGRLIYFFEFACGVSGYMSGVNPFNQPGVEAYKKNMFHLLGKPGY